MGQYTLYIHTSPSGEKSVGITAQQVEVRWNNGKGYISQPVFYQAIQKYGWSSFEHRIIATGLELKEARDLVRYFIREYQANNPEFGYNCTKGGEVTALNLDKTRRCNRTSQSSKHAKKVMIVESGRIFSSAHDVYEKMGIHPSLIHSACRNPKKRVRLWHWQYVEEE